MKGIPTATRRTATRSSRMRASPTRSSSTTSIAGRRCAIAAKPTGSKDPFALRRAAQGIVQILLNRDKRQVKIGIERLIDLAGGADVKEDLLAFFADRVRTILEASQYKFAYDEIAAAMASA